VIGVNLDAIERGEDRIAFKETMNRLASDARKAPPPTRWTEAEKIARHVGYPVVIRPPIRWAAPARMVYNVDELRVVASRGIAASMSPDPRGQSVLGWEELELEVVATPRPDDAPSASSRH